MRRVVAGGGKRATSRAAACREQGGGQKQGASKIPSGQANERRRREGRKAVRKKRPNGRWFSAPCVRKNGFVHLSALRRLAPSTTSAPPGKVEDLERAILLQSRRERSRTSVAEAMIAGQKKPPYSGRCRGRQDGLCITPRTLCGGGGGLTTAVVGGDAIAVGLAARRNFRGSFARGQSGSACLDERGGDVPDGMTRRRGRDGKGAHNLFLRRE